MAAKKRSTRKSTEFNNWPYTKGMNNKLQELYDKFEREGKPLPNIVRYENRLTYVYHLLIAASIGVDLVDEPVDPISHVALVKAAVPAAYYGAVAARARILSWLLEELVLQMEFAEVHADFVNAAWDAFLEFELDEPSDPKKRRMAHMRFLESIAEEPLPDTSDTTLTLAKALVDDRRGAPKSRGRRKSKWQLLAEHGAPGPLRPGNATITASPKTWENDYQEMRGKGGRRKKSKR